MNATESKAMKYAQALFCLGVLVFSAAPALAKPAYVASTVNLRAAPGTKSEIVAKIPGGSLVDTKDCSEGWCEITWQDKSGFAIQTALDTSGRVPRQASQPRAYLEFLCRRQAHQKGGSSETECPPSKITLLQICDSTPPPCR